MSDERPLIAPRPRRGREWFRTLLEAAIDLIPGLGNFLNRISRLVRPPRAEVETQQWQQDATRRINTQDAEIRRFAEALDGRPIQLSAVEVALVDAISHACTNGRPRLYDLTELRGMLPTIERREIEVAAHQLVSLGVLEDQSAIGMLMVRPTQRFYEQFDHQMRGWDTAEDAVALARLMLERNEGHSSVLRQITGWDLRRFNPAQRRLIRHLPSGLVSREIQPDFAASYVAMAPQVLAALQTYIERNQRP